MANTAGGAPALRPPPPPALPSREAQPTPPAWRPSPTPNGLLPLPHLTPPRSPPPSPRGARSGHWSSALPCRHSRLVTNGRPCSTSRRRATGASRRSFAGSAVTSTTLFPAISPVAQPATAGHCSLFPLLHRLRPNPAGHNALCLHLHRLLPDKAKTLLNTYRIGKLLTTGYTSDTSHHGASNFGHLAPIHEAATTSSPHPAIANPRATSSPTLPSPVTSVDSALPSPLLTKPSASPSGSTSSSAPPSMASSAPSRRHH